MTNPHSTNPHSATRRFRALNRADLKSFPIRPLSPERPVQQNLGRDWHASFDDSANDNNAGGATQQTTQSGSGN